MQLRFLQCKQQVPNHQIKLSLLDIVLLLVDIITLLVRLQMSLSLYKQMCEVKISQ